MKLYLNFHEFAKTGSGTWVDYSEALLNEGFVRKSCFGALGKAEMQTVSMRLKPVVGLTALAVNILTATNDIRAKLTLDDDTPYFIGTIRPLVSGEVREVIKPISVEILDDTHFLEAYIFTANATLSSSLMAVSATPANSLVHWLISHAKVKNSAGAYVAAFADTDIVIDSGVSTSTPADGLTIETGDYVNAILDKVCYEYNLQYRCSADGKLHIAPSIPATTITGVRTLTNSDIKNYTNPKRGDDARKGAVVTYYPVVKGACTIGRHDAMDSRYADDKTYGRGYEWLNTDEPGGQWPPAAYQNVTLSTYDLDKSKRKILRYDFATIRTKVTFQDGSKSTAQSMGYAVNNGDGTARVYIQVPRNKVLVKRMDCLCDCWYIDEEDEETTQVHQGQNPEKYEAKYLHSGTTAGALLRAIVLRSTTGNLTHTFQAGQGLGLTPGEVVSFAPSALGFAGYVRIVSVTDHGDDRTQPLVDVVAESVTALSDIDVDTSEQVRSVLQKGGATILRLVTESAVVRYSATGSVEVRAEGDAIDVLDGTVSWELDGLSVGSGVEISLDHDSFVLGLNTLRAVVAISGVDFEDKPLDAELYITMVEDVPVRQVLVQTLSPVIRVSPRGLLKTATIDITAVLTGLPIADAVWTCSDGTLSAGVDAYHRVLDCSTVVGKSTAVTVTVTYEGVAYTGTLGIQKVIEGPVVVENMHGVTVVPNKTPTGEPLVTGDYFLWAGSDTPAGSTTDPVIAYPALTKGEIYEYNGTAWVKSANGDLVMTLFDSFADMSNDVDSTVIGNAVIKKLVAIDAFIKNLKAQNLRVREGTAGLPSILSFDGIDDYVSIPYNSALYPTSELRVEASVYMDTWEYFSPGRDAIISCTQVGGWNISISVDIIRLEAYINGSYSFATYPIASLSAGWHDFVGTFDGRYLKLYVDNTLVDTIDIGATYSISYSVTDGILIGAELDTAGAPADDSFFRGRIKDVAIYSDAAGTTPVATWGMQEGTGGTVYDSTNSHNATIHGATWISEDGTGFEFHALTADYLGRPRFGVFYDGRPIFVAEPDTGKIYFGEHFWYDPSDGAIHTPNDKTVIKADGTIEAVDGSFTGNIVANSGLFKGIFDTTALRLEPGTANSYSASYAGNENQAMNFCNYFLSQGLSEGTFYKASIPSGIYDWRYSSSITKQFNGGDVKYVKFDIYSYYVVSFYDSNLAPLTTSVGDIRLGGVSNNYYVYGTLSITLYTGGDVLQLSDDVPLSPTNLEAYQIYMNPTTGALMAKLP